LTSAEVYFKQEIIRSHGMTGVLVDGRVLDSGTPVGYAHANSVLHENGADPNGGPAP